MTPISITDLQTNAYTPYSQTHLGCVVQGESGLLYPGIRIENASFPLTITAVQVAVFSCLSEGDLPVSIYIPESFQDDRLNYLADFHNLNTCSIANIPDNQIYQAEAISSESIKTELESLLDHAIVSESNFRVACILELDNGKCIKGVNIEYPDWQIGLCAERVAIGKAIASGLIQNVKFIHITASKGTFISPCGACRQVLVEHVPYKSINLYHPDRTDSTTTAAQLLPAFFNGSSLRK